MPIITAQYLTIRKYRRCRVHCFGAILPILSVLGYWAIVLGILEDQVYVIITDFKQLRRDDAATPK